MKTFVIAICVLISTAGLLSGRMRPKSLQPQKFDEFGDVTCEDELARLDSLASELQKVQDSRTYIIVYGGQHARRNEARARAARMKFYLVRNRRLAGTQIITLDGGYRKSLTVELWVAQRGDPMPAPTPTLRPRDVILRGRVRVRGYYCGEGL